MKISVCIEVRSRANDQGTCTEIRGDGFGG
jgi:hypothetical protein